MTELKLNTQTDFIKKALFESYRKKYSIYTALSLNIFFPIGEFLYS